MNGKLVFPEENEAVANSTYNQIIKLRSVARDVVVTNLNRYLSSPKSVSIAMVLIADDPTQMRLVAHLPNVVLEDLRAAKLLSARMEDRLKEMQKVTVGTSIEREEFNELASMVREFPELLVQTKNAISVEVEETVKLQVRLRAEAKEDSESIIKLVTGLIGKFNGMEITIELIKKGVNGIAQIVSRSARYLTGFGEAAGFKDPEQAFNDGVKRALGGRGQ